MANGTMSGRGFLARFLYSFPDSKIGSRTYRTPRIAQEVSDKYHRLIFDLMDIPEGAEPETLVLSEKAEDLIADYFAEHEKFMTADGLFFSEWAAKYISSILRIAGFLHVADMESGNEISVETVQRAILNDTFIILGKCHRIFCSFPGS